MRTRIERVCVDLVVKPDVCDLSCDYCILTHTKRVRDEHAGPPAKGIGHLHSLLDVIGSYVDSPLLRICGGELLLYRESLSVLERACGLYEAVELITNGSRLSPKVVAALARLGNCHVHVSLDGHTLDLNGLRLTDGQKHQSLLDHVERCVDAGIPTEIHATLTHRNTARFAEFIEYLTRYDGKVQVVPFPVRGLGSEAFVPTDEDATAFRERVTDRYDDFESVLPPRGYMHMVQGYLDRNHTRVERCLTALLILQVIDDGTLYPCCNGWLRTIGNIRNDARETLMARLCDPRTFEPLLARRPRIKMCKECVTISDILNLYFIDRISREELAVQPLYAGRRTAETIDRLKTQLTGDASMTFGQLARATVRPGQPDQCPGGE